MGGEDKNLEDNKEEKTLIIEEKLENEREKKNQNQMELKKMQEDVNLSNLKEQDKIQVKENTVEGEKYNKERVTSGGLNKNMTNSRSNATLEGELVSIGLLKKEEIERAKLIHEQEQKKRREAEEQRLLMFEKKRQEEKEEAEKRRG